MPTILDPLKVAATSDDDQGHADGDVFASKEEDDKESEHEPGVPEGFEELPIEIRSLTERYGR